MSIALKHIKEHRFLNSDPGKPNFPANELIIPDAPVSIQNQEISSIKRPTQIDCKGAYYKEPMQISDNGATSLKNEINKQKQILAKNLDSQTLNFWKMIFQNAPSLKESTLISILLEQDNLKDTPSNNTKKLNVIFKDETGGYIKQTSPYSHVWQIAQK